jgi:HAE1 family hydrophobic/amphiphilic exporter-1
VIVYIILAVTFRSVIHPFSVLFSLPFAVVGAALALWLSGSVLGISAMIGLMMLVGVVVTNAIVLLELVQQLRDRGEVAYDALVRGGRTRLRPIWMTALAAALALVPLALSKESGAIIAAELAIVVIGGLMVSTTLTLVVVPVVYSLFDDAGNKLRRRPKADETGA